LSKCGKQQLSFISEYYMGIYLEGHRKSNELVRAFNALTGIQTKYISNTFDMYYLYISKITCFEERKRKA